SGAAVVAPKPAPKPAPLPAPKPAPKPDGLRDPFSTEMIVANDGNAAIRQDGSANDSAGSASRLAIATPQTRCLDAAEALRSEAANNPATDKITALLMRASSVS